MSFESRRGIRVWEAALSDVEGCVELRNPVPLLARPVDLGSPQAPVLSLLDALGERGFEGVDEVVLHRVGVAHFDRRNICGRRAYLQCVLHMGKLAEKGIDEFRSVGSSAYFAALLHGRSKVRPGLPAMEYRRQLAKERGEELTLAALGVGEQATRRRGRAKALPQPPPAPPAIALPEGGGCDDESVFGGSDPGAVALLRPASDAEADTSAASPVDAGDEGANATGAPAEIMGQIVTFIPGRATATHSYADRLSVTCSNAAHRKCSKSRSMALLRGELGVRCAEAFLGAWLAKASSMDSPAHGKYTPTLAEMEMYLRDSD